MIINRYKRVVNINYSIMQLFIFTWILWPFIFFFLSSINLEIRQSLGYYTLFVSIFANFICFILVAFKKIVLEKGTEFLFFISVSIFFLIAFLYNEGSSIWSIATMINVITMIFNSKYLIFNLKYYKIIYSGMLIIFVYYVFFMDNTGINMNTLGLSIVVLNIYLFLFANENKKNKIFLFVIYFLSFILIVKSESRGALLGIIFFGISYYLIPLKMLANKVFNLLAYVGLTIGGVIFCVFYVSFWKAGVWFEIPFSDKSFYTGREQIWMQVLELFKAHKIFGLGSISNIVDFRYVHLHNTMLEILVLYGLPVFVFFILILWNRLLPLIDYIRQDRRLVVVVFGFYSILLVGFFENTFLDPLQLTPIMILIYIGYSIKHDLSA